MEHALVDRQARCDEAIAGKEGDPCFRVGGAKPNHDPSIALHSEYWAVDPEPTVRTGSAALTRGMLDLLGKR